MEELAHQFPTLNEFYVNTSPYTKFDIPEDKQETYNIIYTMHTIDCYCPDCKSVSVFTPQDNRPKDMRSNPIKNGNDWAGFRQTRNMYVERKFLCSRNNEHIMSFFIILKDGSFQKIGQFPSLADINSFEIKKYRKILGDEYYKEFNKAIGLNSHGVGVGSFVYLRRIIENFIIHPAYNAAKTQSGWDDDKYQKSRIREKIELLKANLPDFLTDNSIIYSIVSKGIHELSEDECKEYFPILKSCLEFVLTELEEKRKIEEKKKDLASKLSQIAGKMK